MDSALVTWLKTYWYFVLIPIVVLIGVVAYVKKKKRARRMMARVRKYRTKKKRK